MKRFPISYERFVLLVWVIIFLFRGIRYSFLPITMPEAFLFSAWQLVLTYPLTTYLTKNLLKKAIEKKKVLKFILQFFLFTALGGLLNPLSVFIFHGLEQIGVFPESGFFHSLTTTTDSLTGEFLAGLLIMFMFNFGFCGLRFYEFNLKMREELSLSRLKMLQAQINPHFMFNVLNHVHVLIRQEPELADALLLQYTDILRYQLYSGDKEAIPISQEVQFLKNFVDVEAVRWKNKLNIDSRWEVENPDMEIPPLLFITFVENAFKHVSRSNTQKGYVNIALVQKDTTIWLKVENSNTDSVSSKKEDSGIGLANIKRRLDMLFPGKYSLEADSNDLYYSTKLIING